MTTRGRVKSTTSDSCAKCRKGTQGGSSWIQCDTCDSWYHTNCSGLTADNIQQITAAKYMLFRCDICYTEKNIKETPRKILKDIIAELLPQMLNTVIDVNRIGDLVNAVSELRSEVDLLKPMCNATIDDSRAAIAPTSAIAVANGSSQLGNWSSVVAASSQPQPNRQHTKREPLKMGTGVASSIKGVAKPKPRKHIYIGRISNEVDEDAVKTYCMEKAMGLLHIRSISKADAYFKSFHCVFNGTNENAENPDSWPENVMIGRYRLNEEARSWLKTLPQQKSSAPL